MNYKKPNQIAFTDKNIIKRNALANLYVLYQNKRSEKKQRTGGAGGENSEEKYYYFYLDQYGRYEEKKEKNCNKLIINSGSDLSGVYDFNDTEKDARERMKALIEKNIWIDYQHPEKAQWAHYVSQNKIIEWMSNSEIYSYLYNVYRVICKEILFIIESNWGNLDFYGKYLLTLMTSGGIDKKIIRADLGGFIVFEDEPKVYNAFDAGNFLWAYAACEMGIPLIEAKLGAHVNNALNFDRGDKSLGGLLDDPFDQIAIEDGWNRCSRINNKKNKY
ncbi:MAG: hypothetical protein EHM58_00480 [Ignavibacteriae bacterium]|nr:MAG: hypothetical protein EHM58_00480 [Ignavibacteriota bacterium]